MSEIAILQQLIVIAGVFPGFVSTSCEDAIQSESSSCKASVSRRRPYYAMAKTIRGSLCFISQRTG
jgi:hypothetical protein